MYVINPDASIGPMESDECGYQYPEEGQRDMHVQENRCDLQFLRYWKLIDVKEPLAWLSHTLGATIAAAALGFANATASCVFLPSCGFVAACVKHRMMKQD
jgi:hypothetical protein